MSDKIKAAKPEIKKKRKVSKIWLVPIIALLIGVVIVWDYIDSKGYQIEVSFLTAEDLEANKTLVKNRNVDIGIVKKIRFSEDRNRIIANIEIDKEMNDFLREDSRFWVVRPRIGVEGISGLGTLLSGAYIELSPGQSDDFETTFIGLQVPPITDFDAKGLHVVLTSKGGDPLNPGDPVLYKGFSVGKVETFDFDIEKRQATYSLFIESPYDSLITTNTYFWNVGGFSVEMTTEGVKMSMPSIDTLIGGGVQFGVPDDLELGQRVMDKRSFTLYEDESSVYESREYEYLEYLLLVDDSVAGLYAGASVEYRGIRLGTVVSPYLTYEQSEELTELEEDDGRIAVIIKIEPKRIIGNTGYYSIQQFNEEMKGFIKKGLVASIESSSLIFGSVIVSLDYGGEPRESIQRVGDYPVIPTTSGGMGKIAGKVNDLLTKFNSLPLENVIGGASKAIGSADQAMLSLDKTLKDLAAILNQKSTQQIPLNLDKALLEVQKTLQGFQPNSPVYNDMEKTMSQLQVIMDGLQSLLKELDNKPNSLIFSGSRDGDVEPKAKEQ